MSRSRHVSGESNLADRVQRLEAQVAELQKQSRCYFTIQIGAKYSHYRRWKLSNGRGRPRTGSKLCFCLALVSRQGERLRRHKPQQEARRVRRAHSSRRACRAWIDREDRSAFIRRLGDALLPV
jgi:hypothetical protein